jgi:hypothetical protein
MQKLKERGTNAVPPKKSASAYIIFGKEVSSWLTEVEYQISAFIFMNFKGPTIEKMMIQNFNASHQYLAF